MRTAFFVQPYIVRRHKLMASGALAFDTRADAIAAGARLARFRAGIVVLSQMVDAATGKLGRPEILATHGRVPAGWTLQGELPLAA